MLRRRLRKYFSELLSIANNFLLPRGTGFRLRNIVIPTFEFIAVVLLRAVNMNEVFELLIVFGQQCLRAV